MSATAVAAVFLLFFGCAVVLVLFGILIYCLLERYMRRRLRSQINNEREADLEAAWELATLDSPMPPNDRRIFNEILESEVRSLLARLDREPEFSNQPAPVA